jgi:hypothetical protein
VKRGDLVKHIEDEVLGVVMGPKPFFVDGESPSGKPTSHPPTYRILWMDMTSCCDEEEKDFKVISEVDKDEKIC